MSYPRTQRAIRDLVMRVLLSTPVARAIARKGLSRVGSIQTLSGAPRLLARFSALSRRGTGEAFSFAYPPDEQFEMPTLLSGEPLDPGGSRTLIPYIDPGAVAQGRLIVNVIEAGVSGSFLYISLDDEDFADAALSVPLDSVGMYVTDWEDLDFLVFETHIAVFAIYNPLEEAGSVTLAEVQLQGR